MDKAKKVVIPPKGKPAKAPAKVPLVTAGKPTSKGARLKAYVEKAKGMQPPKAKA